MRQQHELEPVFDEQSRILILGSFPSVKSREVQFYYGHPQNRFWKVLAKVFQSEQDLTKATAEEKTRFLLEHRIALWDVIDSCEITGSSDSSIHEVVPVRISRILDVCKIEGIYTNGKTSFRFYEKYLKKITGITAKCLPSTSPANASCSFEQLAEIWAKEIRK